MGVRRRAREQVPRMPVVYTSGEAVDEWTAQGVPNSIMASKPYALEQVIMALSQLINAANDHQGILAP